jgi:hypothetical protein
LHDERVLAELRSQRSIYNTPTGSRTLGLEPTAADHVIVQKLTIQLPAIAILCTDGFAEMVDHYALYGIESMIAEAEKDGPGRSGQRRPAACIDRRVSLTDERG